MPVKPVLLIGAPVSLVRYAFVWWNTALDIWRGHILLCLEGELHTELEDGRQFILTAGMSYQVSNDAEGHRSSTSTGARLFVVD